MNSLVDQYKKATGRSEPPIPRRYVPRPTERDYKFGEIVRYFAQQSNDPNSEIFEINKSTYTFFRRQPLYTVIKLRWQISGSRADQRDSAGKVINVGVENANVAARKQAAKKMPGIARKLSNPLQLYRK